MELREKIARRLCSAAGRGGFCDCVGGSLGCKVGRGEAFNGENCVADMDQLVLSGYITTAEQIAAIPEIRDALEAKEYLSKVAELEARVKALPRP